jgi:hypothetical protein
VSGDETAIRDYLLEVKKALSKPESVRFVPTSKNRLALASMGLQVSDVFSFISRLEPRDYRSGPEKDRNGTPGEVMVFMRPFYNMLIYVKLKTFLNEGSTYLTILSFHEEGQHG